MNKPVSMPIIVLGGGGHAAVLIDVLLQLNYEIIAYVAPSQNLNEPIFSPLTWLEQDEHVLSYDPTKVILVNGIGSIPGSSLLRRDLYQNFKVAGFDFLTVVSNSATVSRYAELAEGVQILPGAIVNCGARIGTNSIINSGAIVEHHCHIGQHNHLAPRATLSGGVVTQHQVHIGTGANIIQSLNIGENAVIGAGATVTKDIANNEIIYPAQSFIKRVN